MDPSTPEKAIIKSKSVLHLRHVRHSRSGLRCFVCSVPRQHLQVEEEKARTTLERILNRQKGFQKQWVQLFEVIVDKFCWHLVFELCEGGPILASLSHGRHFEECEVLPIAEGVLNALVAAHSAGITHGLLGPDFVLFRSLKGPEGGVKLWGFALGGVLTPGPGVELAEEGKHAKNAAPDVCTAAPEVLASPSFKPGKQADTFSAGALLFYCLCGHPPFIGETKKNGKVNRVHFGPAWQMLSAEAQDFMVHTMHPESTKRMTPADGLKHNWLKGNWKKNLRLTLRRTNIFHHTMLEAQSTVAKSRLKRVTDVHAFAIWVGKNLDEVNTDKLDSTNMLLERLRTALKAQQTHANTPLLTVVQRSGLLHGTSLAASDFVTPKEVADTDVKGLGFSIEKFAEVVLEGRRIRLAQVKEEQDLLGVFDASELTGYVETTHDIRRALGELSEYDSSGHLPERKDDISKYLGLTCCNMMSTGEGVSDFDLVTSKSLTQKPMPTASVHFPVGFGDGILDDCELERYKASPDTSVDQIHGVDATETAPLVALDAQQLAFHEEEQLQDDKANFPPIIEGEQPGQKLDEAQTPSFCEVGEAQGFSQDDRAAEGEQPGQALDNAQTPENEGGSAQEASRDEVSVVTIRH
eukprot:gnl/MRDRNA2_/MRDRNA2_76474_c0_seq2.p1 gnl/MRDRNA2_/MRDRNA2_76474_c0~~gnl/MRDRNA2_/MRDRNA2_76474_c0_seq2.p1  ORF type:complete len:673 (+),score=124.31 gnl/MRDRNA2_/MRDRNA2_76474_c0_seq2:111-2021(+)